MYGMSQTSTLVPWIDLRRSHKIGVVDLVACPECGAKRREFCEETTEKPTLKGKRKHELYGAHQSRIEAATQSHAEPRHRR